MVRAAIGFFVLAILAFVLGATGIAGISMEIGNTLLLVFLILGAISVISAMVTGRKVKDSGLFSIAILVAFLGASVFADAEETTSEKIETGVNKISDKTKSTYRSAKEKGCEVINGKLECAGKKLKHKVQNMSDKVKTEATDIKNKTN